MYLQANKALSRHFQMFLNLLFCKVLCQRITFVFSGFYFDHFHNSLSDFLLKPQLREINMSELSQTSSHDDANRCACITLDYDIESDTQFLQHGLNS